MIKYRGECDDDIVGFLLIRGTVAARINQLPKIAAGGIEKKNPARIKKGGVGELRLSQNL